MIKNKILSFIVAIFLSPVLMSQTSEFSYTIQMQPSGTIINNFDTLHNCICTITLMDTSNVSKLNVKVGTSDGSSDILGYNFLYDVYSGHPSKLAYTRNGNVVTLQLGEYSANIYFIELVLEYTSGTISQPVKWNSLNQ